MYRDKNHQPYFTIAPIFKTVSKQEFYEFLRNYPRSLEPDSYMGVVTYNDFSIAPMWPDSVVASRSYEHSDDSSEESFGRIAINMLEVFNSIKN